MRIVAMALAGLAALTLVVDPGVAADPVKKPPYYASIAAGRARMRTGPARTYPASWLYQRADLPVKVVAVFKDWRRVRDPAGEEGWMLANLLSGTRTAMVTDGAPAEMHQAASDGATLLWRAAPGVVGRLSQCGGGWCRFDVKGQAGFVRIDRLWGVEAGEALP